MSGSGTGRYDRSRTEGDSFTAQDLTRKLANVIRYGVIEKIDHKKARCRVRIGPLSSTWINWHTQHAGEDSTWAPPSAGEQVTIFSPGGNLAQASILGGLYQKKFPAPGNDKNQRIHKLKDGTTITHDVKQKTRVTMMPKDGAHTLQVDKQKQVVDTKGTRLENDKAVVHVKPDGSISKVNQSGGVVLANNGNVYINCS